MAQAPSALVLTPVGRSNYPKDLTLSHVQVDIDNLKQFHLAHFPNIAVPNPERRDEHGMPDQAVQEADLGYYEDGTKRTLTADQIAMFRHSEIQRLLRERRRALQTEEERQERRIRREQKQERSTTSARRFDDEVLQNQDTVDVLMYEDDVASIPRTNAEKKAFLWPQLGGQSK